MYSYKKKTLPKNTIELTITIPWSDISKLYDISFESLRKDLQVEGFRKGKAPKNIAEKKIRRDEVYDHLLRANASEWYSEIVKKEDLKPIIAPKVELKKAQEKTEWILVMTTAEAPDVKLGNYKEKAQKTASEKKKDDIWVPGKDPEPTQEEKDKKESALFQAKLAAILEEAKVEISDLILEEELNRKLAKLVDDVQRVGLTMDAYLSSRNTTQEKLKDQMKKEIEDAYKMEFVIQKIADEAKIEVGKEDFDKLIDNLKDDKDKETAKKNMYYYASLMRKQKTLEYISSL